ncbi:PAS domain S-box-containing protein [Lutibacter oricola]|uniref:histidine kinase n=1 Tax=Lutibacter oricola TaxID=762486 RepID=A0A1H2RNV6_9FLAO|nr:PAS domain S-box protein [Lutibacter oricola]SDW21173.1 PAS domain S-box-containing protein [Lutibacter oricola]
MKINKPNSGLDSKLEAEKYFNLFNHAPISLWLEDFSEAKNYLDKKVKEQNTTITNYLDSNPEVIPKLASLVTVKDVNETTLKIYKAKTKNELLQNLNKVFTKNSSEGFSTLLVELLKGKSKVEISTVNKTLEGEEFDVLIKFNAVDREKNNLSNVIVSIENITERLKAEKILAESQKRYKEAQQVSKIGSWEYDFLNKKLYWSDEAYNLIEIDPNEDLISLDFYLSFVHINDRDLVDDFSISNLLQNRTQQLQYRIITSSGKIKYINEKRSVIVKNGLIVKILGICQDVTERILSEKKLNSTKNLLSDTLSSINDGFVILDYNSDYTYINNSAAKLLGRKPEDLIGKNIWEEFPEEKGDLFYDKYQKALITRKPTSFENYFAPWKKWFENRIIPSGDGLLIFFQEITQKKEKENEIRKAYNIINKSSSVAILCKNEYNFPVEFISENVKDLFGFSHSKFLSGSILLQDIIHKDDLTTFRDQIFDIAKSPKLNFLKPKPFRIISKKGKTKWVRTKVDVIRDKTNKITHLQGIVEDITESKKTEDLFFESNQRLIEQFNNTPLASIMWDLDFNVLDWNNSSERIFGFSKKEAVGKHANELIIPENLRDIIFSKWKLLLKGKGSYRNTNQNITKNGSLITCDWYNVALKDSNDNVIGVASLIDDITDKNKAELALQKSEQKYKDLFEKSKDAVLILKDGIFVDCNESTLDLFGYKNKNGLLKQHPSKISPLKQPCGKKSFDFANELIDIAIKDGSHRFNWIHKRKDGLEFPAEVTLTKIEDLNNANVHAVIRDITERVKKEKLENVIYNISNSALSISDFTEFGEFIKTELNKVIDTNNFYIALYNKDTDTINTPYIADEHNFKVENFPAENTLTGYVIKNKKPLKVNLSQHQKLIDQKEVGMVGPVSKVWIGVPLKIKNNVFGAIAVQSYISEEAYSDNDVQLLEFVANQISSAIQIKDTQNKLEKALAKAQESDRLKSAFLANMSHEIRTPMNGIIGFSELLSNKETSGKEKQNYAEIVVKSSQQLLSIVNDVLDISKIEAGVVQIHNEKIILNNLLDDLYSFHKNKAKTKNLQLILEKGLADDKSIISIDKTKLNQVFNNLISNSFKFTKSGSVEFGYSKIDNYLECYVKDTGVGIKKELQPTIFDRFTQANISLNSQHKGTGLGLAISKKYIELFGGEIWLNSDKNGTVIKFILPYDNTIKKTKTIAHKPVNKTTNVKDKNLTLLIAEDEEFNMMYLHELFSSTNIKIVEASNGEEAVKIAQNDNSIDLVLMDIKMPILNGYEAMKAIKKTNPTLPIIALSAFAMESDKETAIGKGFNSYLTKPIDRKLLFELIDEFSN